MKTLEEYSNILRHHIVEDHIRHWDTENFAWPGVTIGVATITYSIAETVASMGVKFALVNDLRIAGELVGAGGMLLAVVMLASLHASE